MKYKFDEKKQKKKKQRAKENNAETFQLGRFDSINASDA